VTLDTDTEKGKAAPPSPGVADGDNADNADTGKGKARGPSLGVLKDKMGPDACRVRLRSKMLKSFEDADIGNQNEYVSRCAKEFGISKRRVLKIWTEIAAETKCAWAKPGRRRNSA
jgi:hypothetical protein